MSETNPYGRAAPCAQVTALAPDGFAITFQNGIGNVEKLQAALPPERARRLEHGQHSTPRGGPAGARRPARRGDAYWFSSSWIAGSLKFSMVTTWAGISTTLGSTFSPFSTLSIA
jgi:hypothetical protein